MRQRHSLQDTVRRNDDEPALKRPQFLKLRQQRAMTNQITVYFIARFPIVASVWSVAYSTSDTVRTVACNYCAIASLLFD